MKEQLLHLTSLCIDKGLNIGIKPDSGIVEVTKFNNENILVFYKISYIIESMRDYKDEMTLPLNELIKLVEDYEK